jgi:serine/threonine-protein kinase
VTTPKAATPDPEEIAGRYQVVKRLGAGAFGTVYKAKDKVLGRMLAIKTIRMEGLAASGASVEELVDRFKREAQISAQLRHPNIVTIYDVGETEGVSYLAMEFIDGVGLERVIAAAGRLPLERAALIGAQVADALDFAHRHSVVHRDIKPANIMVEAGDRVKVTDFGIAKVTDSGEHLTMTGSLLGTPSYMSPEQARGGKLDGRSDLFAVGAILYEMLAGQKAFRGDSITGLIFKIITEEPQLITELDPTIPPGMVQVIQRALAKAPEQRYQTGREMAEDLLSFTRTGATPTLRQGEIDTLRGGGGAAQPTFSGQSPTVAATQGRAPAPATEIAPPPAPPRPVEPTYLVSSGVPQAPAVDPTYLVGSGRVPPPPPPIAAAPPAPAAASVPPRAAPPAAYAAAPRTARVAQPAKSSAGLVVGLIGAAALLVLVGGGAAWYFLKGGESKDAQTAAEVSTTGGGTTTPGAGDASSGAAAGTSAAGDAGASGSGPATDAGTTAATAGSAAATGTGPTATQTGTTPSSGGATVQPEGTGTGQAAGGGSQRADAGPGTAAGTGTTTAPRGPSREPAMDLSVLDQPPPELTGREAGASVAGTYRSNQGFGASGGSFGASGRLRARAKVPQDLTAQEKRAAVVLLNLRGLQEVHKRRAGSYGNFKEFMPVPVASPERFDRAGYRFELKLEDDGFTIMATSMSGRALLVDDTGYVRYVED